MSPFPSISREELLPLMAGAQLVTVNQRLARELLACHAERQLASGVTAWQRPDIRSWDNWELDLLRQLDMEDRFLTEEQELHLWQQVIAERLTPELRMRLQIPATARMARDAHRLLCQYGVSFDDGAASEDHREYLAWERDFLRRLEQIDALDRAKSSSLLIEALKSGELAVPGRLVVAGFDNLRPDQLGILTSLTDKGCTVLSWSGASSREVCASLRREDDPFAELRSCARWARRLLERGEERIGIVIADPQLYRTQVTETLRSELAPRAALEGGDLEGLVSFSMGDPLAAEPLVATALRLLAFGDTLHLEDVSFVLRSPWVGDLEQERDVRMRLDQELRAARVAYWSPRRLERFRFSSTFYRAHRVGNQSEKNPLSKFAGTLSKSLADRKKRLSPGVWASRLKRFLDDAGWPGERELTSRDFQAHEQFMRLFDRLVTLERLGRPMAQSEAVSALTRLAQETPFQVKEATGTVQVLGLLEATGLEFDHLWVLGMHDGVFPAASRPNPFIPVPLQRARHMPHADASRELDFATRVAGRLFRSAPTVVASCPRQANGSELLPSPFIAAFPPARPDLAESADPQEAIRYQHTSLETCDDAKAPAVLSNKAASGGTALLKDQALCPFRAFAHHRLRCEALETVEIGLDPLQRGTLVHGMLERIWKTLRDSRQLCAMDEAQLEGELAEAAYAAIQSKASFALPDDLLKLEKERLVALGREWLELERNRTPFRVLETEKSHTSTVGRLTIRTQVDRIDALESGGVAIIDYKSGKPDPLQWLEQRLAEPQLPIYVGDYDRSEIAAVLFAQVRAGECRFRGVSRQEGLFPGVPERRLAAGMEELELDCDGLFARWEKALVELGEAFIAGEARVAPLAGETTCRYCDYPALCRIHEYRQTLQECGDD